MSKISYSAPAKVILSGEHSVVHFEPAIISAFNLRLKFSLTKTEKAFTNPDPNVIKASEIVKGYLTKNKIEFQDSLFNYEIESQIPIGQGFGSSAAFSVATTACFWEFYTGQKLNFLGEKANNSDLKLVNQLAYEMEKHFHGNPSGMDNSTSCYGGLVFYRKEFEFLKSISPLEFEVPLEIAKNIYLIDSGQRKETTLEMVKKVQDLIAENGALYKKTLRDIGKTTKAMMASLYENREKLFLDSLARNQKLLNKLQVSGEKANKLLKELEPFGIGKIMGAGGVQEGSGFMLFYCQRKTESLEKYLQDRKKMYFKYSSCKQGVLKID